MAVSIHGNNGVITTNGTAAAPSFAAPDNDTGLYFGTNLIHATAGGSEKLRIHSTGQVEFKNGSFSNNVNSIMGVSSNLELGATATLILRTATNERLRINSDGTVRIKRAVSTSLGNDSIFLAIGDTENGSNVNRMIGFGYVATFGTSVYPTSMGYTETDNSGHTKGALTFNTRNTTGATDVPTERLRIQADGNVAIGTNAVSAGDLATGTTLGLPKLHVDCGHLGNGTYHVARFRAGSDNNNNAAVVSINNSNDNGIALYGGRSTGTRSWGAIRSIDTSGRVTNAFEIIGDEGQGVERISLYTGDSTTTTERLRIDNVGRHGINVTNTGDYYSASDDLIIREINGGDSGITIRTGTANSGLICFADGASSTDDQYRRGQIRYHHNSDSMDFTTDGNTARLTINDTGKVGINQSSPDGMLHVFSASAGSVNADADADELTLENSGNVGLSLLTAATGESSIYFGNPGTNGQKDGWLKYYHESHSTTANRRCLSFKTGGGSEKMRLDASGRLLIGVTAPSTSSSERFEVSGMSLFMNNSSSTGTIYIRNQASDASSGHCLVFQDNSANRGGITLDSNDQITIHGHQGLLFKTGGTLGGGKEVARFNNGGGLQFKNTGCNRGIIWVQGDDACTSMANIQGSGGRGIVETKISNIAANTTTDFAKSHWGGLALIGWAGTGHQGHEQVAFGYGGTPSSQHKRQWQGNLTVTYTMSAYTLRISHNASNALNFWCILIGV